MINVNAKKDWHDIIYLYLQENIHMYCSGSGFPGERFIYIDHLWAIVFSLSIIVFEIMAKNSKVGHFRGNNSYKDSPYNFILAVDEFLKNHVKIGKN
jgi:hypothetical protein